MISSDSCSQLVAGNYDVIVNEPSLKSVLLDYLEHFEHYESQPIQQESSYSLEFKFLKDISKKLKEDKANLHDGELEVNSRKNRYKDILPFNHTRVILSGDLQVPGSGYINANYIKGPSGSPKAYIACQGPLDCTLDDFWQMIWECNVSVIVMACNEIESGKPKCELYWPQQLNTSQSYGNFQVTLSRVRQICSDFLIRKFTVRFLKTTADTTKTDDRGSSQSDSNMTTKNNEFDNEQVLINNNNNNNDDDYSRDHHAQQPDEGDVVVLERTICQFHYTTWPDHGVPNSVQPILELVRLIREVQPADDKPILVHCSAGCGRTGAICCIDYVWGLLRRGKLDAGFNLCNIISEMRQQRMSMVQTIDQYILCHRAVAAMFLKQLSMIDDHIYENLEDDKMYDEQDLGPVFI